MSEKRSEPGEERMDSQIDAQIGAAFRTREISSAPLEERLVTLQREHQTSPDRPTGALFYMKRKQVIAAALVLSLIGGAVGAATYYQMHGNLLIGGQKVGTFKHGDDGSLDMDFKGLPAGTNGEVELKPTEGTPGSQTPPKVFVHSDGQTTTVTATGSSGKNTLTVHQDGPAASQKATSTNLGMRMKIRE